MEKKYELLMDDCIEIDGAMLYRIRAVKDFGIVTAGDIGGYIQNERNLPHSGNCWVSDNARVYNNACVYDNARISGNAAVSDNACVYDNARISDNACVYDNSHVYGTAGVYNRTRVYGDAHVYGNAHLYCDAMVYDNAAVYGNALLYANACVHGDARVYGNASVNVNASIESRDDICWITGFGSKNRTTTFYKTKSGIIYVVCGCFDGPIDEFRARVLETHGDTRFGKEYLHIIESMKIHFEIE